MHKCEKAMQKVEDVYYQIDFLKPRLSQYQVHLTDVCNLKCKGCGHYCSITEDANLLNPSDYKKDIEQIKKKYWGVERIYLLGGEPLLHPHVDQMIKMTREIFPDADIRVTTNGILLPNMKDVFWNAIRDYDAHIEISLYEPTVKMGNKIEEVLEEQGVSDTAILLGGKQKFFKLKLLESNHNPQLAFRKCSSKICHFLRNGHLSVCPAVYLNHYFCDKFGIEQQFEPDGIDLYDEKLDGWEMNKILAQPSVACEFCAIQPEFFEWEASSPTKAKISDWVVE